VAASVERISEHEAATSGRDQVRRELAKLPEDWSVFHDLPLGAQGVSLDHLVVGPGGVIALNTESVTGTVKVGSHAVLVGGRSTQFVRKARLNADLVKRQLQESTRNPVRVDAAIVFVNGCNPDPSPVGDVTVLSLDVIVSWLVSLRSVVNPKILATIARAIARPETFAETPAPPATPSSSEPTDRLVELVGLLKEWRKQRATGDNVPAYVVLSDSDLAGIASANPRNVEDLARCRGIDPTKLERYGDEILAVVTDTR
jgi:superfamily II DNA helicase RecQ